MFYELNRLTSYIKELTTFFTISCLFLKHLISNLISKDSLINPTTLYSRSLRPSSVEPAKIQPFTKPPSPIPQYSKHLPLKTVKTTRPKLSLKTLPAKMGSPPAFGALGAMFTTMRLLQAVSLVSIIGLTSNFVAELVSSDFSTPSALVGTLVVVSFLFCIYFSIKGGIE